VNVLLCFFCADLGDDPLGNGGQHKEQFINKRTGHYNEYKVLQAMRAKLAAEEDDEDEDDDDGEGLSSKSKNNGATDAGEDNGDVRLSLEERLSGKDVDKVISEALAVVAAGGAINSPGTGNGGFHTGTAEERNSDDGDGAFADAVDKEDLNK
jgi:hypothetical protein